MSRLKTFEAKISKDLYSQIEERIDLGIYSNESQVVTDALKKAFAEESRQFLRRLVKSLGIKEREIIQEWKRIRK